MYGEILKQLRELGDYTQTKMAKQLGIAQNTLSQYENNQRETKFEMILRVAEISNIKIIFDDKSINYQYEIVKENEKFMLQAIDEEK